MLTFELYLYCFTQFSGSHKELGSRSNGLVWKDAYSDFTQPWYFIQSIWVSKLKSKQSVCLSNTYQVLENGILKTNYFVLVTELFKWLICAWGAAIWKVSWTFFNVRSVLVFHIGPYFKGVWYKTLSYWHTLHIKDLCRINFGLVLNYSYGPASVKSYERFRWRF